MTSWEDRLRSERDDLIAKMDKLHAFMMSDKYVELDMRQCDMLAKQYTYMKLYLTVLTERVRELAVEDEHA